MVLDVRRDAGVSEKGVMWVKILVDLCSECVHVLGLML